jgi:diguanylate cyclase (GGDEF)-like protein
MFRFGQRFSPLQRPGGSAAGFVEGGLNLGMAARLTLALIAVALLAATANFMVSKTALLFRVNGQSSNVIVEPQPLPAPIALPSLKDPPVLNRGPSDALALAIEGFEWICRWRGERQSKENTAQYLAATQALRTSFVAFQKELGGLEPNERAAFSRSLADYLSGGQTLVRLGDDARASRLEYAKHLESMDKRVGEALDKAWHIFGRVVTRQSLMKFRDDLDLLRQRAQGVNDEGPTGLQTEASLADLEKELSADLATQAGALSKSQDAPWVRDMQVDLAAMESIRGHMRDVANAYSAATLEFAGHRALLSSKVQTATKNAQLRLIAAGAGSSPQMSTLPQVSTLPQASASPAPLPHDAVTHSILSRADPRARATMAAVTAIVMLSIAAIIILTVRSVIVPMRRILLATRRLADGDALARVLPGGVPELATLAAAFNDMAEMLGRAQLKTLRQQESLEAQVMERTRKLQQLSERDPLTSLANRRHLLGRLSASIDRASREGRCIGVYFLDVDNFKNYNDSLGHVFGDRLLMSVANRLEEVTEGTAFVARFGGDEFTVFLEGADGIESIQSFGSMLVRAFHELLPVDDREISVSVSVGASAYPMHGVDAEALLRTADSALFRAKELGRSQVAMFTPQLTESAEARFTTEQGLRRALERGEFELVYQPEVGVAGFDMGLVEALLRWRMPDGRLAKPGEFLAIAEQSGLIVEINDWVLRTAVRAAAEWHHGGWPQARVAINIAPRQLLDERFTVRLVELLGEHRLPARCIELELTESVLQTGSNTVAALRSLQSHGFGIALDDFGTGYSSLTSLEQLPLSRIKLDRSLIVNVDSNPRAAAIATAILGLCAGLELEVTVEGVESTQQLAWLLDQRAVYLQGYLVSEPVPAGEIAHLQHSLPRKMEDLLLSVGAFPRKERRAAASIGRPRSDASEA